MIHRDVHLVQTARIFTSDIRMEFGIEKYATLTQKRGKRRLEGMKLPYEKVIKSLKDNRDYKYLRILQVDKVKGEEMKENTTEEYKKSKKSSRNEVEWGKFDLRD